MKKINSKGDKDVHLYHTQWCVKADTLQIKPEVFHILHGIQNVQASLKWAATLSQVIVGVTDSGINNHGISLHIHKDLSNTVCFQLLGKNHRNCLIYRTQLNLA